MLAVCLHKLCIQDSCEKHTFRLELCCDYPPEGGKCTVGVQKRPSGSLRRALGRLVGFIWPPRPLGSRHQMPLGRSWGALGGSWGRLGASWAAPGASRGAPGVDFGLPGASFWTSWGLFFGTPWKMTKTTKFDDSTALFGVFEVPGGPKSNPDGSQIALGRVLAPLGALLAPLGAVLASLGGLLALLGPLGRLLGRSWGRKD